MVSLPAGDRLNDNGDVPSSNDSVSDDILKQLTRIVLPETCSGVWLTDLNISLRNRPSASTHHAVPRLLFVRSFNSLAAAEYSSEFEIAIRFHFLGISVCDFCRFCHDGDRERVCW